MMARRRMRVEIYPDKQHRWRWRARASNGNIVADSGQGYRSKWHVKRAISSFLTRGVTYRWHSDVGELVDEWDEPTVVEVDS